jgi:hypothetical protein
MFPLSSSLTRRLASLHRIVRGSLLRLPRYHQGVPTSCRPFRPTHCSFVWRYHALLRLMRKRGVAVCRLLVGTAPVPQSSSFARARGDKTGSPRFLGSPFANMLCSSTPADGCAKATNDASDVAFRSVDNVGSAIGHLSRLNHTACSLAVYASRLGLLRSHHARLASRWRPTLAGAGLEPAGLLSKVSLGNVTSHHFDPPSPSFAWRTNRRDAAALAIMQAARLPARSRAASASHHALGGGFSRG